MGVFRIAVFDGEKFDAISGKKIDLSACGNAQADGKRIRTIWGFLAWQLGAYELIEEQDTKRVAPGGGLVKKIIGDKPTLILLNEVSRYLERAMGEKVGESTLYRQGMEFIQIHPALIDLMRERWASIPDFRRTRGVLRFLAVVLGTLKSRNARDYLVSANDIPIDEPDVRSAFFTEVGQREPYQAVLEADFSQVQTQQ